MVTSVTSARKPFELPIRRINKHLRWVWRLVVFTLYMSYIMYTYVIHMDKIIYHIIHIYTKIHNHTNICIFWWISWRLRTASFPDCSVLVPMGQIFAPGQKCWLPEHLPRRPRPWWTQQRPVAKKPRSLFFGFSGCFVWKTHGKLMIKWNDMEHGWFKVKNYLVPYWWMAMGEYTVPFSDTPTTWSQEMMVDIHHEILGDVPMNETGNGETLGIVKQCHVYHPWLGMVYTCLYIYIFMVMTGGMVNMTLFYPQQTVCRLKVPMPRVPCADGRNGLLPSSCRLKRTVPRWFSGWKPEPRSRAGEGSWWWYLRDPW